MLPFLYWTKCITIVYWVLITSYLASHTFLALLFASSNMVTPGVNDLTTEPDDDHNWPYYWRDSIHSGIPRGIVVHRCCLYTGILTLFESLEIICGTWWWWPQFDHIIDATLDSGIPRGIMVHRYCLYPGILTLLVSLQIICGTRNAATLKIYCSQLWPLFDHIINASLYTAEFSVWLTGIVVHCYCFYT